MTEVRQLLGPTPGRARRTRSAGGEPVRRVRPGTVLRALHRGLFRRPGARPSTTCRRRCASSRTSTRSPGRSTSRAPSPATRSRCTSSSIEPARDWAVSTTFPHFGALTAHAHHGDAAPAAGRAWSGGTTSTSRAGAGALPRPPRRLHRRAAAGPHARHGRRRAGRRSRPDDDHPGRARRQHGHARAARRGRPRTSASTCRARCSRSATGTAGRATARCAAPRSRRR